ncbi:oxygen-dependent protoporphyrinogen oxidase [Geranomyces michiganensis]|nr:oxygen-dependent protoporphyrinogen oxidase [Geranomyces michiganensis]
MASAAAGAATAGAKHFAVLGGGISGLSTAWYLTHLVPKAKITLVEKQARLGGWVHTQTQNGQLFELGPRTLRPVGDAGRATLEMVHKLGLENKVLTTSKTSPAAINRYIYSNNQLHHLPTSPFDLLNPFKSKSPLLRGLLVALLREPFIKPATLPDESIHAFVSRRFSPSIADNLVSAVLHGIYAGNAKELSVRSAMPILWEAERKHGSVGRGLMAPPTPVSPAQRAQRAAAAAASVPDKAADEFVRRVQASASIYSFKDGMQTLTEALHRDLEGKGNVDLVRREVKEIRLGGAKPEIAFAENDCPSLQADHIISALPASTLTNLLPPAQHRLSSLLAAISTVDVVTVNLAFRGGPPSSVLGGVNGFGYLIPQTEPTGILGTVFDSCAMPEQDQPAPATTRVTVMMGGHRFREYFGDVGGADLDVLGNNAVDAVRTHLGVDAEVAERNVALHRACIPQYTVGHHQRLSEMQELLASSACGGKLSLVGASYLGVGLNDCVKNARDLVRRIAQGETVTGLERAIE